VTGGTDHVRIANTRDSNGTTVTRETEVTKGSSLALIVHRFPDPPSRARALGVWGGMGSLGVALGPVLGGGLVAAAGWRSIFLVNVPVCLLTIVMLRRHVAESPGDRSRRIDLPGLLLHRDPRRTLTCSARPRG
jgi:MFS family permease